MDAFRSNAIDYKLRDFITVIQLKEEQSAAIKQRQSIKHLTKTVNHKIIKIIFRSCEKCQ